MFESQLVLLSFVSSVCRIQPNPSHSLPLEVRTFRETLDPKCVIELGFKIGTDLMMIVMLDNVVVDVPPQASELN